MRFPRFDEQQRETAFAAYRVAEDATGDHFALPAIDTLRHPVDLRTLIDLDIAEVVAEGALAQVARYDERSSLRSRARTLYRICVQDHAILARLGAEQGAVGLFPLMVYVLTHELVHVVRFVRHQGNFVAEGPARVAEEAIVHEITRQILLKAPIRTLGPVLERFRPFALS